MKHLPAPLALAASTAQGDGVVKVDMPGLSALMRAVQP